MARVPSILIQVLYTFSLSPVVRMNWTESTTRLILPLSLRFFFMHIVYYRLCLNACAYTYVIHNVQGANASMGPSSSPTTATDFRAWSTPRPHLPAAASPRAAPCGRAVQFTDAGRAKPKTDREGGASLRLFCSHQLKWIIATRELARSDMAMMKWCSVAYPARTTCIVVLCWPILACLAAQ